MNLRWNTSDYGGIKDLRIPPHRIWKPDVLMYNSADEGFDGTYQTNVVVRNNGSCLYVPPGIFKSTCKIDITWFPFDDQRCEMKFGSWTYDGFQVWLQRTLESLLNSLYQSNELFTIYIKCITYIIDPSIFYKYYNYHHDYIVVFTFCEYFYTFVHRFMLKENEFPNNYIILNAIGQMSVVKMI